MDHIRVGISSNLTLLKTIVPNELSANALTRDNNNNNVGFLAETGGYIPIRFKYIPLLMLAIISHECTDEGHATVQYLIDQGANPDASILGNVSWNFMFQSTLCSDELFNSSTISGLGPNFSCSMDG